MENEKINKDQIIKIITDFNNRAVEMYNSKFIDELKSFGVKINFKDGQIASEFHGPEIDSIKSICNDIRLYVQKSKDPIKIEKLIVIYKSELISEKIKTEFNSIMSEYYKFKKYPTNYVRNNKAYNNQELFELFLYGNISHMSPGHKEEYDRIKAFGPEYVFAKMKFIEIVDGYLRVIGNFAYCNNLVLENFGLQKILGGRK